MRIATRTVNPKSNRKKRSPSRGKPLNGKKKQELPSFYEEFKEFFGIIKDGPRDLARNHKLYASGAKKWK
jgi:hypothetical protein